MSPGNLFSIVLLITAVAAICEFLLSKIYRKRLLSLAEKWRMNYSPADQFRLTPRVARNFPIPGAANIRVSDLIYGSNGVEHRYIFTAEYTAGIVSGKHRVVRAGTFAEPRERSGSSAEPIISLAPRNLPLIEQYRKLAPRARDGEGISGE